MNDDFLNALRREPSPEFARKLKVRLRELDTAVREPRRAPRATRWATLAASIAAVAVAFTFPAVRAGAQAFLDLFRVVNFTGVAFDPERMAKLPTSGLDLPRMIGEQVNVLKEPGEPVEYATVEEASSAAGFHVRTPAFLPPNHTLKGIKVSGEGEVNFTASTANLQLVLETLGIDDVTIPAGVDGQQYHLRVPPAVHLSYSNNNGRAIVTLIQARTPEVSFPAGLDPAALGEIGLRILGLSRTEAYRIAQSIDWRTTLLVPVPVTAGSFRQITIQGESALVIESNGNLDDRRRVGNTIMIMWSQAGIVHALTSNMLPPDTLIEIAQTLQ